MEISCAEREEEAACNRCTRGRAMGEKWLGDCQKSSWSWVNVCSKAERMLLRRLISFIVDATAFLRRSAVSSRM